MTQIETKLLQDYELFEQFRNCDEKELMSDLIGQVADRPVLIPILKELNEIIAFKRLQAEWESYNNPKHSHEFKTGFVQGVMHAFNLIQTLHTSAKQRREKQ